MTALAPAAIEPSSDLRGLIYQAADSLVCAVTAADVLDARDKASFAYDTAKSAARLARAKGAHDEIIARAYRAQADALEIESLAKRRLADEYDAAQDRGEVAGHGGKRGNQHMSAKAGKVQEGNLGEKLPTVADAGLTKPQIFEARHIRDAIAREPGIVRRVLDDLLEAGDEPTKARLRRELAPAITKMRAQATTEKKERRAAKEVALAGKIEALPNKRYGVILADPEWRFEPYSRDSGMDRSPDNHYPTSTTDDICARDVASIAADDCVLFLWATAPMLPDALAVMAAWGFAYRSHAVWHKQRAGDGRGTGYWFLGEHELLMVGVKGDIPAPAMGTQVRSVFAAQVAEHSAKPETSHALIEAYFPTLPKIELNRRGPARPGWDAWGNEAASEDVAAAVVMETKPTVPAERRKKKQKLSSYDQQRQENAARKATYRLMLESTDDSDEALLSRGRADLAAYDLAVRDADIEGMEIAASRLDAIGDHLFGVAVNFEWRGSGSPPKGNGRFACLHDARDWLISRLAAKDGEVPMFGQPGRFVIELFGCRVDFRYSGLFGIGGDDAHVIDLDKPFFSETGYRSFQVCPFGGILYAGGLDVKAYIERVCTAQFTEGGKKKVKLHDGPFGFSWKQGDASGHSSKNERILERRAQDPAYQPGGHLYDAAASEVSA